MQEFQVKRKKWLDQRRKTRVQSVAEVELEWTGVCTPTLRTMDEVESDPRLAVGQTFPNKDLILLRTAEEANLRGIYVSIMKSSKFTFSSSGKGFYVSATNSENNGWKITKCSTREGNSGEAVLESDADTTNRSPFRVQWFIPIIHSTIVASMPPKHPRTIHL